MKNQKNKIAQKKGFTLIELLIVIVIIGILAGVVLVSSRGGVDKAKRASALTTAASILPELVICQDDGGSANAPDTANKICTTGTMMWPDISASAADWGYGAATLGAVSSGDFTFKVVKGTDTITCKMADNGCS